MDGPAGARNDKAKAPKAKEGDEIFSIIMSVDDGLIYMKKVPAEDKVSERT